MHARTLAGCARTRYPARFRRKPPASMPAFPVLILGMHRSGTSSLAGSLQQRGLFLGDVYESRPHNRKGNRENQRIMDLNDTVLRCSGGAWDQPPGSVRWDEGCVAARDSIVDDLARGAGDRAWGFKDPRTLLTLPFWRERLPQARMLGTFRHPAQVARSLRKRDPSMAASAAFSLWHAYNRRLLALHEASPFPLANFDADPAGYLDIVDAMARGIGLDAPAATAGPFFEDGLRTTAAPSEPEAPADCIALHARLVEAAQGNRR